MGTEQTPSPTRGVPVVDSKGADLLDKPRRVRYSMATRKKLMISFGGEEAFRKNLTGERLTEVLLAGLADEDPTLTVDQLDQMVDLENLQEIVACMLKALGYRGKFSVAVAEAEAEAAAAPSPRSPAPAPEVGSQ